MKSSLVLLKLIKGVSSGGSSGGSGGSGGSSPDIPAEEPSNTVWIGFESNDKTILNSAFYKTKDMEILGQTTDDGTYFKHAGVYDPSTQLYKIEVTSGSSTKKIYLPQELVCVKHSNVSYEAPQERLYFNSVESKYYIEKKYERFEVLSTDINYPTDRQGTETFYFTIKSLTQNVINEKYITHSNDGTNACGNYNYLAPGSLNTIYDPAQNKEGLFLGYNVCGIRVNNSKLTDNGFSNNLSGIQQWLNKLKSDGKPMILYLPLKTPELVEVTLNDINIVTYEGENRLYVSNGNGIIKCQYPTIV